MIFLEYGLRYNVFQMEESMELGIYSFGNVQQDPATGELGSTAQAMRDLLEAIQLADEVGLDYFGVGEHHTRDMPASAASVVLAGAATTTKNIKLGSSVTVLATEDPVRVYQQFSTLDAISHGRAEVTVGRGSSGESFPLFGFERTQTDDLFLERLDLLQAINEQESVTWSGTTRAPLEDALVVPRPDNGRLTLRLGTGGTPGSSVRAGRRGLPVVYGIIGGEPAKFSTHVDLYRQAAAQSQVPAENINIGVSGPGFIGEDANWARQMWWEYWSNRMRIISGQRGFPMKSRGGYEKATAPGGALFVGDPEEVAERLVTLHHQLGHHRHILEMDYGQLPQQDFLRSIELLGTRVKPLVDAELGTS
ncbi:LLM class flavin-dependent oxidoreductase [Corynebacterium sp. A21]|uniref:LLM class flavin-dependent oxidoreductase n=1 Tax=Corynebacterium sp. A21 TaxID=3457318 RepID=UPI003FD379C2